MRSDITMMRPDQLDAGRAMLLIIDMQEKIMPLIPGEALLVGTTCKLIRGMKVLGLPTVVTEQYARGIGVTVGPICDCLAGGDVQTLEKPTFSGWADAGVRSAILALDRPQVIIAGIESHICIQQTALDLASRDYDVFVCADAIGSRGRIDHECALHRMRQNGVFVTTVEAVLLELCQTTTAPHFKAMLEIVKSSPPPND